MAWCDEVIYCMCYQLTGLWHSCTDVQGKPCYLATLYFILMDLNVYVNEFIFKLCFSH